MTERVTGFDAVTGACDESVAPAGKRISKPLLFPGAGERQGREPPGSLPCL
jgi:hypothetical protein